MPFMAKNFAFVIPAKAGTPKGSPLGNPGEGRGRILDRLDFAKALAKEKMPLIPCSDVNLLLHLVFCYSIRMKVLIAQDHPIHSISGSS